MTGWRLGWCVVPESCVNVLENLAQNYYICPSSIAQKAALKCFTSSSLAVCESRRMTLVKGKDIVLNGLQQCGLNVPVVPDSAFYVYIDVSHTGLTAMDFCERVLQEAHVALTPSNDFGECGNQHFVRLSFASSEEDLRLGMERLAAFMRSIV